MKSTPQSNTVPNTEPLSMSIVGACPDELQIVNQAKQTMIFQLIRSHHLTAKSENFTKNDICTNKSGYNSTTYPCDRREKTTGKDFHQKGKKSHTQV